MTLRSKAALCLSMLALAACASEPPPPPPPPCIMPPPPPPTASELIDQCFAAARKGSVPAAADLKMYRVNDGQVWAYFDLKDGRTVPVYCRWDEGRIFDVRVAPPKSLQ
ncbi:MAG: hypothetical protein ACM33T_07240 [Solirubrobacterales bacterium]